MKRIEIIANNSVEEDILKELTLSVKNFMFTKINGVHGIGKTEPKMGSNVWPEENFILVVYCDDEQEKEIKQIIDKLKKIHTTDGIKYFVMENS
jgi:nitrogen regulatory protein PII